MINKIGFDLHGSDKGMEEIIKGLSLYLKESNSKSEFKLFGNYQEAKDLLEKYDLHQNDKISIVSTVSVVTNDDEPTLAIRKKKNSSMIVGATALRDGEIDCFVSSGSTGTLIAAGVFIVGRIVGIDRPALAGLVPSTNKKKPTLILDLGANVEAKPIHLQQYATLGNAFMKNVFQISNPEIALLNIGTEDEKGNTFYKEVFNELSNLPINFVGNIEARDVLTTTHDVVVVDGFSGNILLKAIEGTVEVFNNQLKNQFLKNIKTKISALLIKKDLKQMKAQFDYRELGATPVFGVNKLLLKAHGSSDSLAFKNAFRSADEIIESDFMKKITEENNGIK